MKLISLELKKANITALFSNEFKVPSPDQLKKTFGFAENTKVSFIETPPVKVLLLSSVDKEVIIETNRLLVNDISGEEKNLSTLSRFFAVGHKVFQKYGLVAYGFNFHILIEVDEIDYRYLMKDDLLKIIKSDDLLGGANIIVYLKDQLRYSLEIIPIKEKDREQIRAHLNIEYKKDTLPSIEEIKDQTLGHYKEFKKIIETIFPKNH